ncbi:MAG: cellulase family glycosylhydrolase [Candidatus Margulisbacteria bacterium]|nr:cellulase family glycosylhydrolase [Candidatus Margulisiibacteriota bacterium]
MKKKIRGVNLGGWLVLEKWIKPSLFTDSLAEDELGLLLELKEIAVKRIEKHRSSFIQEKDIKWLASIGINTIRIPYGHWLFGEDYPYHKNYKGTKYPYVNGSLEYLDKAVDWAEKYAIDVVLDLHAAPGCQNGFDNGGMFNTCDWHKKEEYVEFTVKLLQRVAERYSQRRNILAISLLNEPRWDIPTNFINEFNLRAIEAMKTVSEAQIMFHEGFRDCVEWQGVYSDKEKKLLFYDIHRYQCFETLDMNQNIYEHINKPVTKLIQESKNIKDKLGIRCVVGEWSLGLDPMVVPVLFEIKSRNHAYLGLDEMQLEAAKKAFGCAQLLAYESFDGWFFWTYKTETQPEWSFQECVKRGWLPSSYF